MRELYDRASMTRLRRLKAILSLLFALAAAGASPDAARAQSENAPAPTLILLSLDGVRHDFPDRDELPGLARIEREGARAKALVPTFPSLTFPSHVTLATGAPVERHGVVANRFIDRQRGEFDYGADASWIEAEPLWIAAERQGVRAAAFFWVGSETAWRGQAASYRRTPFNTRIGEQEKVEQILAWLDMPDAERPRLIMSWWHGSDHAGHRYGPEAPETHEQLRSQDVQLQALLAGIDAREAWPHTTLMLVSDHGMTRVRKGLDPKAILREAEIEARIITSTAFAHVFLEDPSRLAEARALFEGRRRVNVYSRSDIPAELRYAYAERMGDLLIVLEPPLQLGGSRQGLIGALHRFFGPFMKARGGHGYRPEHPDMHGILYAMGRGVKPGIALPRQRALDIAATAAALLGIDPPLHNEGKPIPGLGAATGP